jgi:hypothetical protein
MSAHGLRLERKGQGLVITDGEREAKASRIARDFSFASLRARLGPYERAAPSPSIATGAAPHIVHPARPDIQRHRSTTDDPLAVVVHRVQAAERAADLDRALFRARRDLDAAHTYLADVNAAHAAAKRADRAFDRHLATLYRDPTDARELFETARRSAGIEAAVHKLRTSPHAYGALRPASRAVFRLVRIPDYPRGLARATRAAPSGRDAAVAAADLRARLGNMPPGMRRAHGANAFADAVAYGRQRKHHAEHRLNELHHRRQRYPETAVLSRDLARVAARLAPHYVQRLALLLTAPQAAVLYEAQRLVKHIALGHAR